MPLGEGVPDVQDEPPLHPIYISRVGVRNVRRRVTVERSQGKYHFDVTIDAFVDLPPNKRGVHMSRNIEAFIEAIDAVRTTPHPSVEKLLDRVCDMLLAKHEYSTTVEVVARTAYFYEVEFAGVPASETADVEIKAVKRRDGGSLYTIRVSLVGMTVCPCAQQVYSSLNGTEPSQTPSHTQRARITLSVTVREGSVGIDELVRVAREAFSAPSISLLKKLDEYRLIRRAFENPRFVEDVARAVLYNFCRTFSGKLPDDTEIEVEVVSYESIHPHDVYAYSRSSLGYLRRSVELASGECGGR